jgi:putative transposase
VQAKKWALAGGKKVKGRKRHIAADTMGNLLAVKVHAANIRDTMSGCHVYMAAKIKYANKADVSEKIKPKQWEILPKRWCVERTFAWMNNSRRLSKDYEIAAESEEAFVMISHLHTLLRRLAAA